MHIVTKVYDDNSADIFDLGPMTTKRYTFNQLANLSNISVYGAIIYNNELLNIKSMKIISFPTEDEATEFKADNEGIILFLHNYWWVLCENSEVIHVDYYVYTQVGKDITYVSESGYTPYIQGAKSFSEVDAIKLANSMTKNSKTGKYWKTLRIPRG